MKWAVRKNISVLCIKHIIFLSIFLNTALIYGLDYTRPLEALSDAFWGSAGTNEGTTSFRSLLIPIGGRAESLGGAYTGYANDISFIEYNPAASSLLQQTEISLFHNTWIADSAMETIAFTTRFKNLGIGGKLSCFYLPFSEYDSFGEKVSSSYYSETTLALNASYNFFAGYTFKGLAIGGNFKSSWRAMPDYANDSTGTIISGSGLEQSGLAFMGDTGIMLQFNLGKFYNAREANFRVGISAMNIGMSITGFNSEKGIKIDDPLPSLFCTGISYRPIRPISIMFDFKQPVNLYNFSEFQIPTVASGIEVNITDFFSVLGGFQLKGGNPRISIGGEFSLISLRFNLNYTLDLTSSLNPINHISLSAKIPLGDKGRSETQKRVEEFYNAGVKAFAERNYDEAISLWQSAVQLDKNFDPAITGIKNATMYKKMLENYTF